VTLPGVPEAEPEGLCPFLTLMMAGLLRMAACAGVGETMALLRYIVVATELRARLGEMELRV